MTATSRDVWEYMTPIRGYFGRTNTEKLYEYAMQSPGVIAEIGIEQGRSASVLMFAARHTGAEVLLVDYWKENVEAVSDRFCADFPDVKLSFCQFPSVEAAKLVSPDTEFSLIHIDADHCGDAPEKDCIAWLPKVKAGGIACFHDYGGNFEAVKPAVDKHTAGWEDLGVWDGLAIRRKP